MAAANMKSVKLRIKSVQSTMQITKAMQLVAVSKLRRAKERAERAKPCIDTLEETLLEIAYANAGYAAAYTQVKAEHDEWLYIVIAGDRGLAGGYNANIFRLMDTETADGRSYTVLPIGMKAVEYYQQQGVPILTDAYAEVAALRVSDCFSISSLVSKAFRSGEFAHIALCYTDYISMLSQEPRIRPMLPLTDFAEPRVKQRDLLLYEPDAETVFNEVLPEYIAGYLYSAINVSVASELAARRMAMEAATDNAQEMIDNLSLYYNRARQASITQEITEIVAGAEES